MLTKGSSGAQMKLFSDRWQPQPGADYEAEVSGLDVDRDAAGGWGFSWQGGLTIPGGAAQPRLLPIPARKAATEDPGHREAF